MITRQIGDFYVNSYFYKHKWRNGTQIEDLFLFDSIMFKYSTLHIFIIFVYYIYIYTVFFLHMWNSHNYVNICSIVITIFHLSNKFQSYLHLRNICSIESKFKMRRSIIYGLDCSSVQSDTWKLHQYRSIKRNKFFSCFLIIGI